MGISRQNNLPIAMDNLNTELVMELFLDDNVSTMNRLIVATADVIHDNFENLMYMNEALMKEEYLTEPSVSSRVSATLPVLRAEDYYEDHVKNFTEEDYFERFRMSKTTVEVGALFLRDSKLPTLYVIVLN